MKGNVASAAHGSRARQSPFSRWREKVTKADEGSLVTTLSFRSLPLTPALSRKWERGPSISLRATISWE